MVHPNVLRFLEYFVSGYGDKIYIVSELLDGGTLVDDLVARKSYTERDACVAARGILSGVEYLHSQGVIHRDLKTANLLLAVRNDLSTVRIADFGLARSLFQSYSPESELDGMVVGTPLYAAPETISSGIYEPSVDCWACGCVLYTLLVGVHPFDAATSKQQLFRRIRAGDIRFNMPELEGVSKHALALLRGLLDVSPRHRLSAKRALQSPWFTATLEGRSGSQLAFPRSKLRTYAEKMTTLKERHFGVGEFLIRQASASPKARSTTTTVQNITGTAAQGERARSMYLITAGTCEVLLEMPGEAPTRLAVLGAGRFVGERGVRLDAVLSSEQTAQRASVSGALTQRTSLSVELPKAVFPGEEDPSEPMIATKLKSASKLRDEHGRLHAPAGFGTFRRLLLAQKYARKWLGQRRNASVRALTLVTATEVTAAQMSWVLERDPAAFDEMLYLQAGNLQHRASLIQAKCLSNNGEGSQQRRSISIDGGPRSVVGSPGRGSLDNSHEAPTILPPLNFSPTTAVRPPLRAAW